MREEDKCSVNNQPDTDSPAGELWGSQSDDAAHNGSDGNDGRGHTLILFMALVQAMGHIPYLAALMAAPTAASSGAPKNVVAAG